MKRDKLRIGVITAALAMMIAGGVLTWQQDARNGKADQAKQGETAQLTEDESTGTTEQQTGTCFSTAASVVPGTISLIGSSQQMTGTPMSLILVMILPQCLQR